MRKFSVHVNPNPDTKASYPLLLDVQSDLVSSLTTRVVVPLCSASHMDGKLVGVLMPVLEVDGERYAMLTPQLAGISSKQIGAKVADLVGARDAIIGALDVLITGI